MKSIDAAADELLLAILSGVLLKVVGVAVKEGWNPLAGYTTGFIKLFRSFSRKESWAACIEVWV